MVGVVSGHGIVVAGAVEAPVPCLRGEMRSILPSPSEAVWNFSTESPIMAHSGDGVLLRVEPMTVAPEPSPMGERLWPSKRSAMNSRHPKRMVLPMEKTLHDRRSPFVATVSANVGTIGTSRGKTCCKSPYLVHYCIRLDQILAYALLQYIKFQECQA
jgi:hypothetical protein